MKLLARRTLEQATPHFQYEFLTSPTVMNITLISAWIALSLFCYLGSPTRGHGHQIYSDIEDKNYYHY